MSSTSTPMPPSERTKLRRQPQRARYERDAVRAILEEGSICHLAFAARGTPHVIPTFYALHRDELVVHGSTANRAFRALASGAETCVTVTLVDGLVLARSAFHHSMNFRSVVVYGRARKLEDPAEKEAAFRALIEKLVPGRWDDIRAPNAIETARTLVLAIPLDEASAKVRDTPPADDDADYALDCWAGILPVHTRIDAPVPDPKLRSGIPVPGYVHAMAPRA